MSAAGVRCRHKEVADPALKRKAGLTTSYYQEAAMSDSNISSQPASDAGFFDAHTIHYAPSTSMTVCGIPLDTPGGPPYTDERDLVVGCRECEAAAAAVPASCPHCGYAFCYCFEAGHAAGLAAAAAALAPNLFIAQQTVGEVARLLIAAGEPPSQVAGGLVKALLAALPPARES